MMELGDGTRYGQATSHFSAGEKGKWESPWTTKKDYARDYVNCMDKNHVEQGLQ